MMKNNLTACFLFGKELKQAVLLSFIFLTVLLLFLKLDNDLLLALKINAYFSFTYIVIKLIKKDFAYLRYIASLFTIPLILLTLSYLSKGEFHLNKYLTNLCYGYFFLLTILLINQFNRTQTVPIITKLLKAFIFIYTFIQVIYLKFELGPLQGVYGTMKNPHFLALYSAICFYLSIYFYVKSTSKWRFNYILVALILLSVVLYTSSRPVWIAMLISLTFCFHRFDKKKAIKFLIPFFLIQYLLINTNTFNYASRFIELAQNITTEERVTIWQDTLELQKKASTKQWLVGHGTKSFYKDFQTVSRYHHIQDFKSPHNVFLELLYIKGIIGLCLIIFVFYFIYDQLFFLRNHLKNYHVESTIGLMSVTTIIILNGLNFPLFSTSFIFPLTLILAYIFLQLEIMSHKNSYE